MHLQKINQLLNILSLNIKEIRYVRVGGAKEAVCHLMLLPRCFFIYLPKDKQIDGLMAANERNNHNPPFCLGESLPLWSFCWTTRIVETSRDQVSSPECFFERQTAQREVYLLCHVASFSSCFQTQFGVDGFAAFR